MFRQPYFLLHKLHLFLELEIHYNTGYPTSYRIKNKNFNPTCVEYPGNKIKLRLNDHIFIQDMPGTIIPVPIVSFGIRKNTKTNRPEENCHSCNVHFHLFTRIPVKSSIQVATLIII